MFTTGSKLFFGLSAAALTGFLLYGFLQEWTAFGVIGLAFAVLALGLAGGTTLYARDAQVPRNDAGSSGCLGGSADDATTSVAPLVGALGAGLLVLGFITDRRWFVAGVVFILIALVDWTVQTRASRASDDPAYNKDLRDRMLLPLQLPLLGALGLGVIIFSFSRVMLTASTDLGPVLFVAAAAIITIFGFIFAARRRPGRHVVASLCVIGVLGIVVPGVWAASNGERAELEHESEEYEHERIECGEEPNASDEDSNSSVSAKASVAGEVTLKDNRLTAVQSGKDVVVVQLQRSNPANLLFKNENNDDTPRRLNTVYLVNKNGTLVQTTVCTHAIDDGDTSFLTLIIPVSSSVAPEGHEFTLVVPGVEGAEIEIEVP